MLAFAGRNAASDARVNVASVLLLVVTVGSWGCSTQDGPQRVLVSGTVSFSNLPVEAGQIRFKPMPGTHGAITIAQIVAGNYTTEKTIGVPIGEHHVEITGFDAAEYEAKRNRGPGSIPPKQLLPAKYNEKSELTLVVSADSDSLIKDFALDP
jgi:hypothetical protein